MKSWQTQLKRDKEIISLVLDSNSFESEDRFLNYTRHKQDE